MVTNLTHYFTDSGELRKEFRVLIEGQFEHDLYKKSFSNQLESDDVVDALQQRIEWWILDKSGIIPNDVNHNNFDQLYMLFSKVLDSEMQVLVQALRDRQIIPR